MKIQLSLLLFMSLLACKSVETNDSEKNDKVAETQKEMIIQEISHEFLLGTWQNVDNSEIDFLLHLNIDDGTVAGEYCSKARNFYFEDCAQEDGGEYCSVRGRMEQLKITLETESCVTLELGKAELTRKNKKLFWKLVESPGEYAKIHLMPDTITLKKISNEPFF